jgi:predicted GIY-YIG superfamily endonuclease
MVNTVLPTSERPGAYYVYLAYCVDGTFYVGYTKNVERRIAVHNAGNGGRYTRSRRPLTLVAAWPFDERCDRHAHRSILQKKKQVEVECTICGKMRFSCLFNRAICNACYIEERNGRGICSCCNMHKVISHKKKQLCKRCHMNDLAPQALRRYLATFTSPHQYNVALFELFTTLIDWNAVDDDKVRQLKVFGNFLQTYHFDGPLTWEIIEEALPPWRRANNRKSNIIRICLLELGHLMAERGELESHEVFTTRRNALRSIECAPEHMQPVLVRYSAWLWERQNVPADIGNHLAVLADFWFWCKLQGIWGPEGLHTAIINDYLLTLYWQWRCSICQGTMPFDPYERTCPHICAHCSVIGSLSKIKRLNQETVRGYRGKLRVFFDWAKTNHLVITNPVQRKVTANNPSIEHYTLEVIQDLCRYIPTPDAHPIGALILYLIIFHACSVWELRHAQLPTLYRLHDGIRLPTLAESYHILLPQPPSSRGDYSPGRPNDRVDFPTDAAPWLQPLLDHYEHRRHQVVKNANNRYVLFSSQTAHHNIPVGKNMCCASCEVHQ